MNICPSYTKNGITCHLELQHRHITLYRCVGADRHFRCYEVLILRQNPRRALPNGQIAEASVRLPGNEEFGKFGWSFTSRDAAQQKFIDLSQRLS